MFLFKKIAAPFLFPLSICSIILLLGLFFLWFTRKQKTGKIFISVGFVLLTTISYVAVSDLLLGPLESKYLPITDTSAIQDIKWVVVLGGGSCSDPKLPITDQLSAASLIRLVEGIRIHKKLCNSKMLLSGGGSSISKDTKDQARFIQNIIGNSRFVLVTSASHMARSVALFESKGMKPMPAPIEHQVKKSLKISPIDFFPSAKGIDKMERVVYEYLGIAWARLKGQISP
jgi:uncharacterized SAM-binding protein YcdF (DUF218 family)